jgi:hypothetical protein
MGLGKGCSCAHSLGRQLRGSASLEPVWITDDLLADTFRRFARNSKRYGSHIPGPLEARKRAPKRLNTHTAFNRGAPPPLDPTLLFPASAKCREPLVERDPSPSHSFLPQWLFPTKRATAEDESHEPAETKVPDPKPNDRESLKETIAALRSATSVEEVQNVNATIPDQFNQLITSSVLSVWVGLDSKWTVDEMAKLLTEPHLRLLPGKDARNILRELMFLPPEQPSIFLKPDNWAKIFSAVCRAVELGLVEAKSWRTIVKLLPKLLSRLRNGNFAETTKIPSSQWHTLQMLTSLRNCPVLSIKDLDAPSRFEVWRQVHHLGPLPPVLDLLNTLVSKPHPQMETPATYMAGWLSLPELNTVILSHKEEIRRFLLALPKKELLQVLSTVTENLLRDSKQRRRDGRQLLLQREILIYLTNYVLMDERGRHFLTSRNIRKIHESFGSESTPVEKLIMTFWLLRDTCYGWDRVTDHGQVDLNHRWIIESIFWRHGPDPSKILKWLAEAVRAQSHLPLPDNRAFLLDLTRIISRPMSYPSEAPRVTRKFTIPSLSFRSTVQMLSDKLFWVVAKSRFRRELVLLCDKASFDLPLLLKILKEADADGYDGFHVVSRVFYRSRTMKLALQQILLHRAEWRSVSAWEHAFIVKSKPFPGLGIIRERSCFKDGKPLPSPEVYMDVISHMVLHIATNEKLANTLAFNRVRWFWRFLRSRRVRISPVITRCLWHAGVTRFAARDKGYPRERLRWILAEIVRWEGPKTARLLAMDGTFRKHRADMLLLLKEIIDNKDALTREQLSKDGEMAPSMRDALQSEDDEGFGLLDNPQLRSDEDCALFDDPDSEIETDCVMICPAEDHRDDGKGAVEERGHLVAQSPKWYGSKKRRCVDLGLTV